MFAQFRCMAGYFLRIIFLSFALILSCNIHAQADLVSEADVAKQVIAPYSLGEKTGIEGVWSLRNGSGMEEGFVIQSEALAPLPGFSGAAINMLIFLDLEGKLIDVQLLNHNEPIFVSGLGEAPFRKFLQQYRGLPINTPVSVGTNYGATSGGSLTYLDGVSKATASVRIAHESVLSAAREVAKQKLQGMRTDQSQVTPKTDSNETFTWAQLIEQGWAKRLIATHGQLREKFSGSKWQNDDPFPDQPDSAAFADMWVVDITAPPIARAVMKPRMYKDWLSLSRIAPHDQTILLIEQGMHGLVDENFVRNTSPPLIQAHQDSFPLSLRDADLLMDLKDSLPEGRAMVVRIDRRSGFNPLRDWDIGLLFERAHGFFQPEIGQQLIQWRYKSDPRFYDVITPERPPTPFEAAVSSRFNDIILLWGISVIAMACLIFNRFILRKTSYLTLRLLVLVITLGFIGWWGQGQLSIVTPLATLSTMIAGKSLQFLLYDPFSLSLWGIVLGSFFIWGRALFCGWLCPFGALQECVGQIAKKLQLPQIKLSQQWDNRLKILKYLLLLGLIGITIFRPDQIDTAAEIEPFKTAISVFFIREWPFVLYAVLCVLSSLFIFKAYCRFLCPLGAFMALGGALRIVPWIKRRAECGSPCQLCRNSCAYNAIPKSGEIQYSECFGCLECVDIYEDHKKCVPLILAAKRQMRVPQ